MKSIISLQVANILSNEFICWYFHFQGLIQKGKVHINCEEGAQINFFANKMAP